MADINGGALEFEVLVQTGQLEKGLDAARKSVQEFTANAKTGGETMDAAYRKATERINQCYRDIDKMGSMNAATLQKLQSQYDALGAKAAEAFQKGTQAGDREYSALKAQQQEVAEYIAQVRQTQNAIAGVADELLKEEQALNQTKEKTDQNAQSQQSLRTQYRQVVQQLAEMEEAGQRNTAEFARLQKEAGRLNNALGDAAQQAKILAHDNGGLQGVIQAASGVTGAFTAANGVLQLFGAENENLQKSMLKVQSLMSVTMGLQQVANTLNKDSYFRIVLLGKAQQGYAAATNTVSASLVAMGVSATAANVAAKALMATLTLGIGVAITAVVTLITKLVDKQKEAKELAKKMNDAVVEAAVKPVTAIRELAHQYDSLGDDMKAKEKFVKDNQKAFADLGVKINDVAGAENALVTNKDAFVEAQMAKAKALAAMQLAQEKAKELLEEQLKLENMPDKVQKTAGYTFAPGQPGVTYEVDNNKKAEQKAKVDELDKELEAFYKQADKYSQEYRDKMDAAGIIEETGAALEGSIKAQEEAIRKLQDDYSSATTDSQRQQLQRQIDAEQQKLNAMKGIYKDSNDEYRKNLQERKKMYEQYRLWADSTDPIAREASKKEFADLLEQGETYLTYLQNQRDRLLESIGTSQATKEQAEQLRTLNSEIATETNRTVLQEFDSALQAELQSAGNVLEMLDIIRQRRQELAGDEQATGKSELLDEAERQAKEQMEQQTGELLDSYSGYLAQKLRFDEQYAENRALLERRINDETASQNERAAARAALAALEAQNEIYQQDGGDEEYRNLLDAYKTFEQQKSEITSRYARQRQKAEENGNRQLLQALAEDERKELSALVADTFDAEQIEGLTDITVSSLNALIVKVRELNETGEITDKDMKGLIDKLKQMKTQLADGNLFKQLASAGDLQSALQATAGIASNFQSVAASLREIGSNSGNEAMVTAADAASDIMSNLQAAEQGAEAWGGWWGAIIGGVIDLIPKIQKWSQKDTYDSMARHAEQLGRLQSAYDKLSYTIDRLMGTAWFTSQAQLITNLQQQRKELEGLIHDENNLKNTDSAKIAEYQDQIAKAEQQMQDIVDKMREAILGTDVASMANDLGSAIVSIFNQGGDAAEAWGNKVKDIVRGVVQNVMVQSLLAGQIQKIVDGYTSQWVDSNGNFKGWDSVLSSVDALAADLTQFGEQAVPAMQEILERFPDLFGRDSDLTTMSGAYKTASQESIDLLGGQTNAMRAGIDQGVEYLRQQLLHIAAMDSNIANINSVLQRIDDKLTNESAALRAQGMTY